MRVLVTGGAGFIGSAVVERLLTDDHDVVILDNFSNGSRDNLSGVESHPRLRDVIAGDVADESVVAAAWKSGVDVCLHLAAEGQVQKTLDEPQHALRDNIIGTYVPLMEARRHGTRFVFMSSCMVYGSAEAGAALHEASATVPLSVYAATKLAGEQATLAFHRTYGLPVLVLRPFNTYGPFQKASQEGGVVSIFLQNSLEGRQHRVFGDGTQTRDLLYIDDCAEFVTRAALAEHLTGEIVNAGTGRETSVLDLAELVDGNNTDVEHVPHIHSQCEIQHMLCDASKAERLLEWAPRVALEDGLARTRAWLAKQREGTLS
jgi:nucleoside-diphosphate-sugar epimerase